MKKCPKVLECGHTFCNDCLLKNKKTENNKQTVLCFTCRAKSDLNNIRSNFVISSNINHPTSRDRIATCNLCLEQKIAVFCSNGYCSYNGLKSLCKKCFDEYHPNCWSISIPNANKMLNKQVESFIEKKCEEIENVNKLQENFNNTVTREQHLQMRHIEEYYKKLQDELKKNHQKSVEQLKHYFELKRIEQESIIELELNKIAVEINEVQEIQSAKGEDLVNAYTELFEHLQPKFGETTSIPSQIQNPKVLPNGLKWFPSYTILMTGDWEEGKTRFIELVKNMGLDVTESHGKCKLYYGATQLTFYFEETTTLDRKYVFHFTKNANTNTGLDCTVITDQPGAKYFPIDPEQLANSVQKIHEIIRDNFF
ncbi:unnamed protein product [Caenorhabditis angaria]|uniref:RING-type domain-containing protein n=1 Tax=Caenorhabditis angaria TaxID=860376 RepID=A0A9P1IYS2_9PELO|nr:unnamed protein product [Caenorhabditis angaria]